MKRSYLFAVALTLLYVSMAQAQYPMMDMVANKVIQKYQSSTCEQLWEKKAKKAPPSQQEQNAITDAEERSADARRPSSTKLPLPLPTRCSNAA